MKLDTYAIRARTFPVYITVAPTVLLLAALLPEGLKLPLGATAAVIGAPVSFLLSQVGADFGKRLEKQLWCSWGGPPTTRFLRHGNEEFNPVTRTRIHSHLRTLGLHVPTQQEQGQDRAAADTYYEACTKDLIRRTRNQTRFPLVFKDLTQYGFRRNLLGLKPFGLSFAFITLAVLVWAGWTRWTATGALPPSTIVAGLFAAGLCLLWLVWVTPRTVRLAADRYARQLLEAALEQT